LQGVPDCPGRARIVEQRKDVGLGLVVSAVVRQGSVRVGDCVVSGEGSGRIKALFDSSGRSIQSAGTSVPVSIAGLKCPVGKRLGDTIIVVPNEQAAHAIVKAKEAQDDVMRLIKEQEDLDDDKKQELKQSAAQDDAELKRMMEASFDEDSRHRTRKSAHLAALHANALAEKKVAHLTFVPLIVRSDVAGSLQAITDYVALLPQDRCVVQLVKTGLGQILDTDVKLAAKVGAHIVGFNVGMTRDAEALIQLPDTNVKVHTDDIVYRVMDEIRDALSASLPRIKAVKVNAAAEVKQLFELNSKRSVKPVVAGCVVVQGTMTSDSAYRIMRRTRAVFEGRVASLRHFDKVVPKVAKGSECGIMFDAFPDIHVDDRIECIETTFTTQEFDDSAARQGVVAE
jgi:translation initiation factor IF-2